MIRKIKGQVNVKDDFLVSILNHKLDGISNASVGKVRKADLDCG